VGPCRKDKFRCLIEDSKANLRTTNAKYEMNYMKYRLAVADIQFRMICVGNGVKHICDSGRECPLKVGIRAVSEKIQRFLDGSGSLGLQDLAEEGGVSVGGGCV
jgi:hypothetical protein